MQPIFIAIFDSRIDSLTNILSCVLVTNNAGSGLDEGVYLLLIHTTNNYTYLQRYHYLHTFQSTVVHAIGLSAFINRLLVTDLITETITSNHYKSSCYFIFNHSGTSELKILLD
jgi:hypothetical protein